MNYKYQQIKNNFKNYYIKNGMWIYLICKNCRIFRKIFLVKHIIKYYDFCL